MKKLQESSEKKQISLNVPLEIYIRLKTQAIQEHRSLNQQIIFLLGGVQTPKTKSEY